MFPECFSREEWENYLQTHNKFWLNNYWPKYQRLNELRSWMPEVVLYLPSAAKNFWEAENWCNENCKKGWNNFNTRYWEFESSYDAMIFKMKWAGL